VVSVYTSFALPVFFILFAKCFTICKVRDVGLDVAELTAGYSTHRGDNFSRKTRRAKVTWWI
jgi:hypothetical protein